MESARQRSTTGSGERGAGPGGRSLDVELVLEELRERFAQFRLAHPPRTRVPEALRHLAIGALEQGVTVSALRRHCGLGAKQVADWRRLRAKQCGDVGGHAQPARVFDVTNLSKPDAYTETTSGSTESLELRIGCWAVTVRPLRS